MTHTPLMPDLGQSHDSPLSRLDARVRLVMAFGLVIGILITPDGAWPAYPLLWAIVGSLAALARLSVWGLARRGLLILPFMLAALPLVFTTPGPSVVSLLGLRVSEAGLLRVSAILLRGWLAAQVLALLIRTTPFPDLLGALASLWVPGALVTMIALMVRYLAVLQDEASRLLRARAARSAASPGHRAGGTVLWRAQVAGGMVGSLFLRSYERSERVYAAMLARGYAGQPLTPALPPLAWRAVAWGLLPLLAVGAIQVLAHSLWSG